MDCFLTNKKGYSLSCATGTGVWQKRGFRASMTVKCFYQHLCMVDSEVLRNPPERKAPKR